MHVQKKKNAHLLFTIFFVYFWCVVEECLMSFQIHHWSQISALDIDTMNSRTHQDVVDGNYTKIKCKTIQ